MAHLETFAKGKSDAPHGHAMYALLDTGSQVTIDGAAQLLKRLGVWPKHVPTPVVRAAAAAAAAAAERTAAAVHCPCHARLMPAPREAVASVVVMCDSMECLTKCLRRCDDVLEKSIVRSKGLPHSGSLPT
jgi:hypothetical protein